MASENGARQVTIWVPDEGKSTDRDGLPRFGSPPPAPEVLRPVKVDAAVISESLSELINSLDPVFDETPGSRSRLKVDEIELKLTLSAKGEVGFIASVSASAAASITVKLKR